MGGGPQARQVQQHTSSNEDCVVEAGHHAILIGRGMLLYLSCCCYLLFNVDVCEPCCRGNLDSDASNSQAVMRDCLPVTKSDHVAEQSRSHIGHLCRLCFS